MNVKNILETINMIEEQKLDIRTITMGISLLDCIDSDGEKAREKIYKKRMPYINRGLLWHSFCKLNLII